MSLFSPPYPTVPGGGGLGAATLASRLAPYTSANDLLLGGTFGIGRTGLSGLAPLPPSSMQSLYSFANQGGLAGQVRPGVGAEALNAANALRPAAAAGGGAGGLASQAAGLAGRFANPVLSKASLAKAGGYGLLGSVGSGFIDQLNPGGQNSNVEQALQGAAQGAGLGAGIGSIFPGIGTGVGAAIGGVAGGAIGVLGNMFGGGGGEEEADPIAILSTAINTAGLDAATTEQILTVYETQMALAESLEGDAKDAAEQAALDQAGQMVLASIGQQETATQGYNNTLALQAQARSIFEPLAKDTEMNAAMYAQALQGISDTLPENMQGMVDYKTASELSSANRLANAYRAQAAIIPTANQLTQYQQDQQNYAAQMFSQMLAQQASAATPGAASQQDVLAALQG